METGKRAKAAAISPESTLRSSSSRPRIPPTKSIRLSFRKSVIPIWVQGLSDRRCVKVADWSRDRRRFGCQFMPCSVKMSESLKPEGRGQDCRAGLISKSDDKALEITWRQTIQIFDHSIVVENFKLIVRKKNGHEEVASFPR